MLSSDFHTVGPPPVKVSDIRGRHRKTVGLGGSADFAVPTGSGVGWKLGGGTMVTSRQYLADAEFLIAISHPVEDRVTEIAQAMRNPVFMTYLGRKAFAPTFPFHLGVRPGTPKHVIETLPTRSDQTHGLTVHHLLGDRNFAVERVSPPIILSWEGWKS
jgi:CRISPR system Cascade subunit CasD